VAFVPRFNEFVPQDLREVMKTLPKDGLCLDCLDTCQNVGIGICGDLVIMLEVRNGSHIIDEEPLLGLVGRIFGHQLLGKLDCFKLLALVALGVSLFAMLSN